MDMDKLFDIAGKKVIVPGGCGGLGMGMATVFNLAGWVFVLLCTN